MHSVRSRDAYIDRTTAQVTCRPCMRITLITTLLLLLSASLAAAQSALVGKWFGDDERYANSSRVLIIESDKAGRLKSGGFTDELAIFQKGSKTVATITTEEGETPQTVLLTLETDGRLRMTADDGDNSSSCLFRREQELRFVQPLIGNWTGVEAWGTIEESGWGTLHLNGGVQRIRLDMTKEGLVWSIRLFSSRQSTPLEFDSEKETLTVKCQVPWTITRNKSKPHEGQAK